MLRVNQETGEAIELFRRTSLAEKGVSVEGFDIHVIAFRGCDRE